LGLLKSTHF